MVVNPHCWVSCLVELMGVRPRWRPGPLDVTPSAKASEADLEIVFDGQHAGGSAVIESVVMLADPPERQERRR